MSNALGSDSGTDVDVFAAILGLIAATAHADGVIDPKELITIENELTRIPVFSKESAKALVTLVPLLGGAVHTELHNWARLLRDKTSVETRLDLLDVLLEISAADNSISLDETNLMRRIATLLGLDASVYSHIQTRHRDKLAVLLRNVDA